MALSYAFNLALEPHHIDNIARQLFRGNLLPGCRDIAFWVKYIAELEKANYIGSILAAKCEADKILIAKYKRVYGSV